MWINARPPRRKQPDQSIASKHRSLTPAVILSLSLTPIPAPHTTAHTPAAKSR
jgi:hypothetical protein